MKPLFLLCLPALALASTSSKGSVALEGRAFWPDDEDVTEDFGAVLVGRLEWKGKHKPLREKLRVVGRVAAIDEDRSNFVVEEAWVQFRSKYVRVLAGVQLLNWTATEAFHPADVVNSRNFDGNVENPDKVGEPMVSVNLRLFGVHLTGYYMPVRMDPILPGGASRLSFGGPGVSLDDPLWVGRNGALDDGRFEHQWAARLATTLGSADISLHAIQHNDRSQPGIAFETWDLLPTTGGTPTPRPVYGFVTQYGLTYAHAVWDFVLKLEGAHRRFEDVQSSLLYTIQGGDKPDHTFVAAGLEYGWSYETAGQATVILEGQAIVDVDDEEERKALSPFQRDALVGYRHDFDDAAGTNFTLGAIVDLEGDAVLGTLTFGRRLGETWSAALSARLTFAGDGPLEAIDASHFAQLTLARHF